MIPQQKGKTKFFLNISQIEKVLFYSLILLLPTQLGKHFWPEFSSILGIRIDYLSPTVYFTDVLVIILFGVWLIRKWSNGQMVKWSKITIKPYNHLTILAVLVISYLLLVIGLSGRIMGGLYSLLKLLEMAFVAYYTAKFTPHHDGDGFIDWKSVLSKAIPLLAIGVVFESILAILQFFKHSSVGGVFYFLGERTFNSSTPGIANASLSGELVLRPYGTFPHPNVLAGYLVVVMTLILFGLGFRKPMQESGIRNPSAGLRTSQELWKRKALIHNSLFMIQVLSIAFGTIALLLSMSRIAIILWVLIVGYFFVEKIFYSSSPSALLRVNSESRSIAGSRLARTIFLISLFILFILSILSPIASRFTNIKIDDEAIVQREVLINSSIKMFQQSPLFGVGLGNFLPTLAKMQASPFPKAPLQPVHNIFLLVLAETGIIGFSFFTWIIWKTYIRIRNQESGIRSVLLIAFSSILILGLFDHYWLTLQQGQLLFAFVIGICWIEPNDVLKMTSDSEP